jgi:hypothetical protein
MRAELQNVLDDLRHMATPDIPTLIGELAQLQAYAQLRLTGPMPEHAIVHLKVAPAEFLSVDDIAVRWRCSRGTVYNRLRGAGAFALDFTSKRQSRCKRSIPRATVLQIEEKFSKRIS